MTVTMRPRLGGYYTGGPFGPRPGALAESALFAANLRALFALASCSHCGAREGEWVSLYDDGHPGVFLCERCV